jgi:plasmid stability protein
MTEVRIRNVDDWVVEWHRQKAKREGRSLESELRETLTNLALERKRAVAEQMRADMEELRRKYGEFPDSTPFLREDRDR